MSEGVPHSVYMSTAMHHNASAGAVGRLGRGGRVRAISATYRYARRHGDRCGVPAPVYTPEDRARFALYADDDSEEAFDFSQLGHGLNNLERLQLASARAKAGEEWSAIYGEIEAYGPGDWAREFGRAGMWSAAIRELLGGLTEQDTVEIAELALQGAGHLGHPFRCLVDGARRAQPRVAAAIELARAAHIVRRAIQLAGVPASVETREQIVLLLLMVAALRAGANPPSFHAEVPVPRVRARQIASINLTPRLLAQRPLALRG